MTTLSIRMPAGPAPATGWGRVSSRGVRVQPGSEDPAATAAGDLEANEALDAARADLPEDADSAIGVLYHEQWSGLVRLASLLTRDASVAEEIVQDSFVALHRRWASLGDRRAARAYLRTSVVNGARSALRHRQVVERHREPGPIAPPGPEELAVRASEDAVVLTALRRLAPRQQEVLILRYYCELSEREIAEALGVSPGAVKSHAHRGLAALRTALSASTSAAPSPGVSDV